MPSYFNYRLFASLLLVFLSLNAATITTNIHLDSFTSSVSTHAAGQSCTDASHCVSGDVHTSYAYVDATVNGLSMMAQFVANPDLQAPQAVASFEWDYSVTISGGSGTGTAVFCPGDSASTVENGAENHLSSYFGQNVFADDPRCHVSRYHSGGMWESSTVFTYDVPILLRITIAAGLGRTSGSMSALMTPRILRFTHP